MFRKTLTIFALVGLLLCVGLWGLNYHHLGYATTEYSIEAVGGVVSFTRRLGTSSDEWMQFGWFFHEWRPDTCWLPGYGGDDEEIWVSMSLWMPILAFSIVLSFSCLRASRRRWRKKARPCAECGQDLRGSEERCPKCGSGNDNPKLQAGV